MFVDVPQYLTMRQTIASIKITSRFAHAQANIFFGVHCVLSKKSSMPICQEKIANFNFQYVSQAMKTLSYVFYFFKYIFSTNKKNINRCSVRWSPDGFYLQAGIKPQCMSIIKEKTLLLL